MSWSDVKGKPISREAATVLAVMPYDKTISADRICHATGFSHEDTYRVLAHLEAVGSVRVSVLHKNEQVVGREWERM